MFRGALGCVLLGAAFASALSGCGSSTIDSLGNSDTGGDVPSALRQVSPPASYHNIFVELLGKSKKDIASKRNAAFQQLFHGDNDQTIFLVDQDGSGKSAIQDVLHDDVRAEGQALGMLISVELNDDEDNPKTNHKEEFDQLWLFTKYGPNKKQYVDSGWGKGYFKSHCGEETLESCYDTYAMQLFVLTLMLAHARWGSTPDMPYESDALQLLDALKNKEAENGGVKDGFGSAFSPDTFLVREDGLLADAGFTTRSSLQMPAAYWYWGKATGMPFWSSVENASRELLWNSAHPMTGLWPMRSYFDGATVDGSSGFTQQAYRTQLNLALDALWGTATQKQTELAAHLARFFGLPITEGKTYGGTFETDGTVVDSSPAQALVSVNGTLALSAQTAPMTYRTALAQAVWDQPIPTGDNRYYEGLMYLTSLLLLSGQMKVY